MNSQILAVTSSLFSKGKVSVTLFRGVHRIASNFKHDIIRPDVDWSRHGNSETFSPVVRSHIEARDFENSTQWNGVRRVNVVSLFTGETTGSIELNNFVFGVNPRIDIIHRNMHWYRACIRSGTAHVKSRAEVRGGGKKPWQQKGLGKARHGSIRSPLWRKGGKSHAPQARVDLPHSVPGKKPYAYNLPYPVRRLGLRAILSCRLAQGDLTVFEDFDTSALEDGQEFAAILRARGFEHALLVDSFENESLMELTKDLTAINVLDVMHLLVYHVLVKNHLLLSLSAVRMLEEKLCDDDRIINTPNYDLLRENTLLPMEELLKEYDPYKKLLRDEDLAHIPPKRRIRHLASLVRRDFPRSVKKPNYTPKSPYTPHK